MTRLILLRHGESVWNQANLFTGWVDVPLSTKGIEEAFRAGDELSHLPIDIIFTTPLCRASMTAMLAMSRHHSKRTPIVEHSWEGKEKWGEIYSEKALQNSIPVVVSWELNERMYGHLQGLNKAEVGERFGKEQLQQWRRSYDIRPPGGECLADTAARSIPYFEEKVVPYLQNQRHVLIVAHGNSLRSIVQYLDNLSHNEVLALEIPTGKPILYEYENACFKKGAL